MNQVLDSDIKNLLTEFFNQDVLLSENNGKCFNSTGDTVISKMSDSTLYVHSEFWTDVTRHTKKFDITQQIISNYIESEIGWVGFKPLPLFTVNLSKTK